MSSPHREHSGSFPLSGCYTPTNYLTLLSPCHKATISLFNDSPGNPQHYLETRAPRFLAQPNPPHPTPTRQQGGVERQLHNRQRNQGAAPGQRLPQPPSLQHSRVDAEDPGGRPRAGTRAWPARGPETLGSPRCVPPGSRTSPPPAPPHRPPHAPQPLL